MDAVNMEIESADQLSASALPFARSYQIEALEKAIKQNTLVYLETGSGKTLIAIMLLRNYAYLFRKPSPHFAVFLVPQVVLVTQQAEALKKHTDLKVGMYWGDMGVDYWDESVWKQEVDKYEVLVMTPAILLNTLRHSFLKLNMIKVLVFDECHHARGNAPYACIMKEFYHREKACGSRNLPRIFGMTASPINTKGGDSSSYWKDIQALETLMNSKVYTCVSESVLAGFIPFSTPKFKLYMPVKTPYSIHASLMTDLDNLKTKHQLSIKASDLNPSTVASLEKKISRIHDSLMYCLDDLGLWLGHKAAHSLSGNQDTIFPWGDIDVISKTFIKKFCLDAFNAFSAYIPSDPTWNVSDDIRGSLDSGLLTSKTVCLIESLLEYSELEDIRCIVFVERVITSIVVESLLAEILPKHNSWKTNYLAGNHSGLLFQTRRRQNMIVEDFRRGSVNIIVATSILEEGLDVQSCNLVIRFDPSATVCSFIQSRGRARMQNSDYLMMVQSGDLQTHSRLQKYISSGNIMREESLLHALDPCPPLQDDMKEEDIYRVPGTGAFVTLSSSVSLIYFYCSRLPSDGYFKPAPRFDVDKDGGICTIYLPKSSPIKIIKVQGQKQDACLEACRKLHEIGALTDNLVPDVVVEEASVQEIRNDDYNNEQPCYFPPELVGGPEEELETTYHIYLIKLNPSCSENVHVHDVLLGTRVELEDDIKGTCFELTAHGVSVTVTLKYIGVLRLHQEDVVLCRRFQTTLFRVLLDHDLEKLSDALDGLRFRKGHVVDFLLLPLNPGQGESSINWKAIKSVNFTSQKGIESHTAKCKASRILHTKDGLICTCRVQNTLVYTPYNGYVYCINGVLDNLNANSILRLRDGRRQSYREYYEAKEIHLAFLEEPFLLGRHIFTVHNYFKKSEMRKEKDLERTFVELPPEICSIIVSDVSMDTIYSFSFIPSIMHRLESLLIAFNLKKMHLDHSSQRFNIPTIKILEAITTKKSQDQFHLESLETLGDSFLKYAASQQLFKAHENLHEGLLSLKRQRIISNAALCNLGFDRKLPGFIRSECFEPKTWMVPGEASEADILAEDKLTNERNIYTVRKRNIKPKTVADVVEALIGAYLSEGGEVGALMFMDWVGIKVEFTNGAYAYERELLPHPEKFINIDCIESLLNYKFQDRSLLVEAFTHGSYMLPEIPRCYQRLEFLGDAVLDYLITKHLYNEFPSLSPGLLTDMRSASVNNECYARAAVKAKLHQHILHASHDLHKHISRTVDEFDQFSSDSTFGWDSETSFPKALGDVIESVAGAILVDSGYDMERVFLCMKPLFGRMVTPGTLKLQPVRELAELCQREHYERKTRKEYKNGEVYFTVEVEAQLKNEKKKKKIFVHTAKASDKKMAEKLAHKEVLKMLKAVSNREEDHV